MTTVRAKFKCESRTEYQGGQVNYKFLAAIQGDDNKQWSIYTPSGSLEMSITNPSAQVFIPGEYYYLDIIPTK